MKQVNSSDDISWRRQSTKSDALLTVKNFDNILCESFALTREASKRVLGLRHFDTQFLSETLTHNSKMSLKSVWQNFGPIPSSSEREQPQLFRKTKKKK